MSQWMMSLILRDDPICPFCACDLLADVATFRNNVAMCVICSERITSCELYMLTSAIDADPQTQNYSTLNGLLFHVPRTIPAPRRPLFHVLTGRFVGNAPSYDTELLNETRRNEITKLRSRLPSRAK